MKAFLERKTHPSKNEYEVIPIKILVIIEKWAMVRRSDMRNAMPFVISVKEIKGLRLKG